MPDQCMRWLTPSINRMAATILIHCAATMVCHGQSKTRYLSCDNENGEVVCHKDNGDATTVKQGGTRTSAGTAAPENSRQAAPDAVAGKAATNPVSSTPGSEEVEIAVEINGKRVSDFSEMVQVRGKGFYATAEQFSQWRLPLPKEDALSVQGETFYPLEKLPGIKQDFNSNEQLLSIHIPATDFLPTVLDVMQQTPYKIAVPDVGLFLNHQMQFSQVAQLSTLSGLFETGFFSKYGLVTSRFVEREFITSQTPVRLDTQFVREFPTHRAKLTIGDAVSSSGPWAEQVNFGGISWSTDFTSQPGFLSLSLPNVAGQASLPSTVDIYVNNVRTTGQSIDAGPFAIKDIPVITPEGNISMVITDVLGRQQIVTQSYITTRELLRPGVSQYTYELGSIRRAVGIISDGYGAAFLDGTHRYGLTRSLTINGRVEVLIKSQTVGGGFDYALSNLGLLSGGIAVDHGPDNFGMGGLAYVSFTRRLAKFGY